MFMFTVLNCSDSMQGVTILTVTANPKMSKEVAYSPYYFYLHEKLHKRHQHHKYHERSTPLCSYQG